MDPTTYMAGMERARQELNGEGMDEDKFQQILDQKKIKWMTLSTLLSLLKHKHVDKKFPDEPFVIIDNVEAH